MGHSIFFAKILGPIMLIVGLGLLMNQKFYQKVLEDYSKNAALAFFCGILPLVVGIIVVLVHNVWVANWRVIITIYGWGGVIKGVWMLLFPESVYQFIQAYQKNKKLLLVQSVLVVIFGVALTYFGYCV